MFPGTTSLEAFKRFLENRKLSKKHSYFKTNEKYELHTHTKIDKNARFVEHKKNMMHNRMNDRRNLENIKVVVMSITLISIILFLFMYSCL